MTQKKNHVPSCTLEVLIKNVSASRLSSILEHTGEEAALQPSRRTLHRRSPRGATQPPHTSRLTLPPGHRESIEFAEIPRVPLLVPDSAAHTDVPEEENAGELNGTARARAGKSGKRGVKRGGWRGAVVHSSGVLRAGIPASWRSVYRRPRVRSHALPYAEQQRDAVLPRTHSLAGCIQHVRRRNTCMHAHLRTRVRTYISFGREGGRS